MKKLVLAIAGSALIIAGCATKTQTNTLVGGLGGAATGAIVGQVVAGGTGATLAGAAIGAAGGAIAGKLVGEHQERKALRAENKKLKKELDEQKKKK